MTVCMDGKTILEDEEYECIVHALGLTRRGGRGRFGRRWAYRNYFAAGGADVSIWRQLEVKGLARQYGKTSEARPYPTFMVTAKGVACADVAKYIPKGLIAGATTE